MATLPDDKVQEVRDRIDIVDLIGRYVELRRAGRNYKGLCPFHQEKSPSFNVNPERKGYKCFGCGAGGDGIRFVMEVDGKSFPEAVRKLGELYGVTLPAPSGRAENPARAHERDQAYAIMRAATDVYERILHNEPTGAAGRTYLEARGLTVEIAKTFRLGYAPAPSEGGWDTLVRALEEQGCSMSVAQQLGLLGKSERASNLFDKFRGRLMFPVVQPGGEVVAFSGRIVPPHDVEEGDRHPPPKYVNSSESLLYNKGKQLFGLAPAGAAMRTSKRAILVEGNIDVVKLHQWGHEDTVAPLGTALTPGQVRLLARFARTVILCFDGDKAGKKAAWTALPMLLEADLDVRIVLLPEGEDPDSVGPDRFGALLERPRPALKEMMIRAAAKAGDAPHARAAALDRFLPMIARLPRESARALSVDAATELFKLPRERIESGLKSAHRSNASPRSAQEHSRQKPSTSQAPVQISAPERSGPDLPAGQAELTMLLLDLPHLATVAQREGVLEYITDSRLAPLAKAVIDGAQRGEDLNLDELLQQVDEGVQPQVYDAVFAGHYRDLREGANPQSILADLINAAKREALVPRLRELDRAMAEALAEGYPEKARQLSHDKLELQRQLDSN